MKVIGLTGGIAAGKSTVTALLQQRGIPVFDYDATVHDLYDGGSVRAEEIFQFFRERLPEATKDARIDRQIVSDHAFRDPALLRDIEQEFMYHSDIIVAEWLASHQWRLATPVVVLDVPLLFQMNWAHHCSTVAVVDCPDDERRRRALRRPGMTEEKVARIMAKQMTGEEYRAHADHVFDSSRPMLEMADQVSDFLESLEETVHGQS